MHTSVVTGLTSLTIEVLEPTSFCLLIDINFLHLQVPRIL